MFITVNITPNCQFYLEMNIMSDTQLILFGNKINANNKIRVSFLLENLRILLPPPINIGRQNK
jgi:hypothetical protein